MHMSDRGVKLLKSIEQLRLVPYDDQTGEPTTRWCKGATIGYGHLILQAEWPLYKSGITKAEAEELFVRDLAPRESTVTRYVRSPLQRHQFDALVILVYHIGRSNFATSSVVKLLRDPSADTPYPCLEGAWKAWNKSQGEVNRGLINRRAAEWRLFTTGAYTRW